MFVGKKEEKKEKKAKKAKKAKKEKICKPGEKKSEREKSFTNRQFDVFSHFF